MTSDTKKDLYVPKRNINAFSIRNSTFLVLSHGNSHPSLFSFLLTVQAMTAKKVLFAFMLMYPAFYP